jgi:ribonuclease HI
MREPTRVTIHTDGACSGNPGPGGYAALVNTGDRCEEICGGRRRTTSNRMEIMAAIAALAALEWPSRVTIHSDSRYMVDAIMQGQAQRWRANGWKRNRKEYAVNGDLWRELLDLCEKHEVDFVWVPGHSGDPDNERCHRLSVAASRGKDLPDDVGYEKQLARATAQLLLFD